MLKHKTITGVVLARAGSKGIKLKNIQLLAGRPLIYYVIKAAQDSGIFDQLYISSDSARIGLTGAAYGAKFIRRPTELASDTATSEDALAHALSQVKKTDYVALLEPTHPLLSGTQLRAAASNLIYKKADAVIGMVESDIPYVASIPINNSLRDWFPKKLRKKRRQDIEPCYYIGGGIYIAKWDVFASAGDLFDCKSIAYVLPKIQGIDINNREDLRIAEAILSHRYHLPPSRLKTVGRVMKRILIG